MKSLQRKVVVIFRSLIGDLLKFKFLYYYLFRKKINTKLEYIPNLIVSFTSFGRRVNSCTPYAAFSILTQKTLPEAVIVYLDETRWNDNNLPKRVKYLVKMGLKVRYCHDLKSYTKLIPALKEFPTKIIVTVDDDIWYSKYLLVNLYRSHLKDKNSIIANRVGFPTYNNNELRHWKQWVWENEINRSHNYESDKILALGVGGVLYPPNSLDIEVFNNEVFQKLCPHADDIWFYVMAIRNKTNRKFTFKANNYFLIDTFYQITHKNSSLLSYNRNEDETSLSNNKQLSLLLSFYKIKL